MLGTVGAVLRLVPLITTAVGAIERWGTGIKGRQKQDAAVHLTSDLIPLAVPGVSGWLNVEVLQAVRTLIDAIVGLMNALEKARQASATSADAGTT